ncbi:MAG: hypothetical protein F6K47_08750 [Symploca sp. SIO2E6]|nr:hypothetical protein [Symploca sp. SIO2E6]
MKNFWRNLPQSAKVFLTLFLLCLSIIRVSDLGQLPVNLQPQVFPTPELKEVGFIVVSKVNGEPIRQAEIQFTFDGAPETRLTNDEGYVRIDVPKRNDIDILIRKKGFKNKIYTINLQADPNRTTKYSLEPITEPTPTPSLSPTLPETSPEVESILNKIAVSVQNWKNSTGHYPDDIGTNEINLGTPPGTPGNRVDWPTDFMYNIDYDHWPLGNGFCYVHVASLGEDGKRNYPRSKEVTQSGKIRKIGDDVVLGIDVYKCGCTIDESIKECREKGGLG